MHYLYGNHGDTATDLSYGRIGRKTGKFAISIRYRSEGVVTSIKKRRVDTSVDGHGRGVANRHLMALNTVSKREK